jgi:hypothetical protein
VVLLKPAGCQASWIASWMTAVVGREAAGVEEQKGCRAAQRGAAAEVVRGAAGPFAGARARVRLLLVLMLRAPWLRTQGLSHDARYNMTTYKPRQLRHSRRRSCVRLSAALDNPEFSHCNASPADHAHALEQLVE